MICVQDVSLQWYIYLWIAHRFWQELCPVNTLNSGLDMIINFVPPWCDCKQKIAVGKIWVQKQHITKIFVYTIYYIYIFVNVHIYIYILYVLARFPSYIHHVS